MMAFIFAVLTALPGGARAQTYLSETFARPGLVAAPGLQPSDWDTEAGKLSAKGGTGQSDSRVLRMLTRRADIKSASVSLQLLTASFNASSPDDERPWDGVHLVLRYQSEDSFYDIAVNRRDGTVAAKKKAPGAQGSTFYTIGAPAAYAVPLNTWQAVRASVSDEPNGTVSLKLYVDGALLLNVADDGSQGGSPIAAPGRAGLRGDNAELHVADIKIEALDAAAPAAAQVLLASTTVSGGQATVSWRTSDDADSAVDFGPTTAYGSVALGGFGRDHSVVLTGLAPGTLYHYRARSRGRGFTAAGADRTFTADAPAGVAGSSPTVSLTSPSMGQELSGTVSVTAAAADGSGQAFVKFFVDGTPLGAELAVPPYSITFNTALVPSGPHTVSAVARNAAGLTSVSVSSVTISNGATVHAAASAAAATAGAVQTAFTQPETAAQAPASAAVPAGADASAADPAAGASSAPPPQAAAAAASTALSAAAAAADPARAAERFLSPALADGINDAAHFGAQAVEVSIFDIRGRRVFHAARQGAVQLVWNGRDAAGRIVESGVYIAKIIRSDGKRVYQSLAVAK
jgi:hypothetical protein